MNRTDRPAVYARQSAPGVTVVVTKKAGGDLQEREPRPLQDGARPTSNATDKARGIWPIRQVSHGSPGGNSGKKERVRAGSPTREPDFPLN
jgi:hypothetical protein